MDIYFSFFCYSTLLIDYFGRVFLKQSPFLSKNMTLLLFFIFFLLNSSDEYSRFHSLDPFILLFEKGVLAFVMNTISSFFEFPEAGFILLFGTFFCFFYLFFQKIVENRRDWDSLVLATLTLSPILISPNNFRQNIAILVIGLVFWFTSEGRLSSLFRYLAIIITGLSFHFSAVAVAVPLFVFRITLLFWLLLVGLLCFMIFGKFGMSLLPFDIQRFIYATEFQPSFFLVVDDIFDVSVCLILAWISRSNPLFVKLVVLGVFVEIALFSFPLLSARLGVVFEIFETFIIYLYLKSDGIGRNSFGMALISLLMFEQAVKIFVL